MVKRNGYYWGFVPGMSNYRMVVRFGNDPSRCVFLSRNEDYTSAEDVVDFLRTPKAMKEYGASYHISGNKITIIAKKPGDFTLSGKITQGGERLILRLQGSDPRIDPMEMYFREMNL